MHNERLFSPAQLGRYTHSQTRNGHPNKDRMIEDSVAVCNDHNYLPPITLPSGTENMRNSVGSATKLEEADLGGSTMVVGIDKHGEGRVILHVEVNQVMQDQRAVKGWRHWGSHAR